MTKWRRSESSSDGGLNLGICGPRPSPGTSARVRGGEISADWGILFRSFFPCRFAAAIRTKVTLNMPPSAHLAKLRALIVTAYNYWVTRSLAVGAVATAIDVMILLACVKLLDLPTPIGAMTGVAVGSTFTFFANRYFAFRDHRPELAPQALRFAVTTGCAMLVHASLVWWLRDWVGIDVVYAKLIADVLVFSVGQLLVLRYIVFRAPRRAGVRGS